MLKYKLTLLWSVMLTFSLFAQNNDSLNMEQLYNYDDDDLLVSPQGVYYNDCWGYADAAGNEYAIIGSTEHIFFFNVTDPENTTLIRKFSNGDLDVTGGLDLDATTWRDFKTYGEKAYACADQSTSNEGLIVFDLSELPDTVTVETQTTDFFTRAHNIFIDTESGYLYTAGAAGSGVSNVRVLDLNTDPIEEVANVSIDGGYTHDIHVVNDTAYCNSGWDGLYIIDFTDHANPVTIGSLESYTNSGYNHSGWLTEDGKHYVFCDENFNRKVKILDVSDPVNVSNSDITDQFFSNLLNPGATNPSSIAHNPFIIGDLVYIAYYDDGVQVFDISDPDNVVVEAYYDTHDGNSYTADGVWGVYPFLPSGTIIASDVLNGLFLIQMNEAPLLVEFIDFKASLDQSKVRLEWATASERNSEVFEIERSTDGENFETIGNVQANNNSTIRIDYEYYDEAPLVGLNYYRLKQIDFDGDFQYSDIKSVRFLENAITLAPTLVKEGEAINLFLGTGVNNLGVEVFNTNGQLLKSYAFGNVDSGDLKIPLSDLQNGLYIFKIKLDQEILSEKIMIAK